MEYASSAAFRTGLEARLLNQSREAGIDLGRLRRRVVFERLLARLARSAEAGWVLKGGMALEIRMGDRARATKDLDLALRGISPEGAASVWIRETLVETLASDPDSDGFEFRILDDRPIMPKEAGQDGWRFRIDARLAGKTFDKVRIDVAPGFEESAGVDRLRLPSVLSFAGIDPIEVDAIDRREHFAEKLHALTRPRDRPNTRVKDLADLMLLIDDGLAADAALRRVVERVFASAGTHELTTVIEEPPEFWDAPFAQLAADLALSVSSLEEGLHSLRAFWATVLTTSTATTVVRNLDG